MRRCIIVLVLIFCVVISRSQTVELDSLKNEISKIKESNKSELYLKIVKSFFHVNIDSTLYYVSKVEDYASLYKDRKSLSIVMAYKAYVSHLKGNDKDVVKMFAESRRIAVEINSEDAFLETYNVTGVYFLSISQF